VNLQALLPAALRVCADTKACVLWMAVCVQAADCRPLRCCVQEPVVPMCFMRVRPIGVMQMLDQGEQDDKLIAVHADDPEFKHFSDISQLPPHRLNEIRR
jgi:hypothetical protein